jgi:hypothetical protein
MSDVAAPERKGIVGWFTRLDDGAVVRAAFFALLSGTLAVLYIDYRELTALDALIAPQTGDYAPILPPASAPDDSDGEPWSPQIFTPSEELQAPLEIALESGGILRLTGSIEPGSAQRFVDEVSQRGEYVETIVLNSPGGSVTDAIAIGRAIRENGFDTLVEAGSLCASSCPLILAGGVERNAAPDAAIGVHQIYATTQATDAASLAFAAGTAMSEAQRATATITRYLIEVDVDPALWIHALETPPDRLYYLTPQEVSTYRLITEEPLPVS